MKKLDNFNPAVDGKEIVIYIFSLPVLPPPLSCPLLSWFSSFLLSWHSHSHSLTLTSPCAQDIWSFLKLYNEAPQVNAKDGQFSLKQKRKQAKQQLREDKEKIQKTQQAHNNAVAASSATGGNYLN